MLFTFSASSFIVLGLLQFESTYTNGQRISRSSKGQSVLPPYAHKGCLCMANGDSVFPVCQYISDYLKAVIWDQLQRATPVLLYLSPIA